MRWDDGTLAGVDMVDQDLDVVVRPDLGWEWKDEEEFAERLAFPDHYWVTDADGGPGRGEAGDRAGRGGGVPVRRHLVRLHPAARLDRPRRVAARLGPSPGALTRPDPPAVPVAHRSIVGRPQPALCFRSLLPPGG